MTCFDNYLRMYVCMPWVLIHTFECIQVVHSNRGSGMPESTTSIGWFPGEVLSVHLCLSSVSLQILQLLVS